MAWIKTKTNSKRRQGVPKGYKHNWKYTGRWSEKKVKPGTWKIDFKATKKTKAKAMGPKPGSTILWKIDAYQKAKKTGKGKYQTHMYGIKRKIKSKMKY